MEITPNKVKVVTIFFQTRLEELIVPALSDIWYDFITPHVIPNPMGSDLKMAFHNGTFPLDEYANYLDLKDGSFEETIDTVEKLAGDAAKSYVSNVQNAFRKNGRMTKFRGERLHVTDWKDAFHFNIAGRNQGGVLEDTNVVGWVAYKYRFAAAKLKG